MHLLIRTISDTGNHYTIICDKPTEECSNQKPCQYTTFLDNLCGEALLHSLPVDNLPDGLEVLGLAVLVLEVVGVLPGVDAEEGLVVAGDGVLVGAGDDGEVARGLVLDEPGPAGALDAGEGGVGLLLEVFEGAEVLLDGGL